MNIDPTKLDQKVAERYSVAADVRRATIRLGATVKPDWQIDYKVKYPPKMRNSTNQRCFEADRRIEIGAVDTEAPYLMSHHLRCAQNEGRMLINQIAQETRMNLPGGNKIRSIYTRYRNGPELLKDRITPVTHIANMEIDPTGMFAAEFGKIQAAHENDIDAVMQHYESTFADKRLSTADQKMLRTETIKEFERLTRIHWAHIDAWINQALQYLTGNYMKGNNHSFIDPDLQRTF